MYPQFQTTDPTLWRSPNWLATYHTTQQATFYQQIDLTTWLDGHPTQLHFEAWQAHRRTYNAAAWVSPYVGSW